MGFFDDLVFPEEPAEPRGEVVRLGPWGDDAPRDRPPADWFAPALVPQLAVAGAGPAAKVLVTGWSVWPDSVTLHLSVHRLVLRQDERRDRQSGLRVGLLLADGRQVTSLDAPEESVLGPAQMYAAMSAQGARSGLIPLDPALSDGRGALFRTAVDLYLPELPPPGVTRLVVEWPDEDVPETATPVDADALRAAATRAMEVWPGLPARGTEADTGPELIMVAQWDGPPEFLARPASAYERRMRREQEEERVRYVPRADWEGMRYEDWGDAALLRARLDGGARADAVVWSGATPLHLAAERGDAAAVAVLLPHVARVDVADEEGHTALWHAACRGDEESVRALVAAGADVWSPQTGPWSPGRLLLTTPLAPTVAGLPGAVPLPAEELAAFRAADALIEAFDDEAWTEGLGIAFVRDLDEEEVVRRLGADPARCPEVAPEHAPFDKEDYDAPLRYVSVTALPGSPGGCVITQDGYMPSDDGVLQAISPRTTAYGVYFNPKGGTHGTLVRDGRCVDREEIYPDPDAAQPSAYWRFRFWQSGPGAPYTARELAYACAAAGLRVTDGRAATDNSRPRRWVELPPELRR
ncbi:ankyrin repeat domain-containing protein [Streptomyces sp. NPDC058308]|uniref:ankyrin repeat domain-containing protein n=1 Tax=Streptomyces sp. NPDC058308 TaxID=3346440 RepID=UPI0036E0D666